MKTLVEIERAVEELPSSQKTKLLLFVAQSLREEQAPLPEPRLLLGVVGNNAGFLRMDPARGRNLHQLSCHQRTLTTIVGPGQPIPEPNPQPA